ncbi:hypothetical protein EDC04DRAFT_984993 [Pisolithus marmoratus]|nr:hypothetical protein EDC04DRAFT_984993 [Pisolithus marmoratus]
MAFPYPLTSSTQDSPIASLVVPPCTHILPTSKYVVCCLIFMCFHIVHHTLYIYSFVLTHSQTERAYRSGIDTHTATPFHPLHHVLCSRTRIKIEMRVVSVHMCFFGFSFTSYVAVHIWWIEYFTIWLLDDGTPL